MSGGEPGGRGTAGQAWAQPLPPLPAACRTRPEPPSAPVLQDTPAMASSVQVQPHGRPEPSLNFWGGCPHRAPFISSRPSPPHCPILGLTLPSDLFLSLMPSSPVLPLALCLLLRTLWDHLPLEVDPCAHGHGGCSPHANCTKVAPGQRTCTCQDGYMGDGELCQGETRPPTWVVCGARGLASVI